VEPAGIDDAAIASEGRVFARYLVGRDPSDALVERYVAASAALFPRAVPDDEARTLAFARRHPWSVGALDAASGLLRPGGAVRSRILLMAALLETTPDFADDFLPRDVGPAALELRVGIAGVRAVALAIVGAGFILALGRRGA
jgi:hypothetical protein